MSAEWALRHIVGDHETAPLAFHASTEIAVRDFWQRCDAVSAEWALRHVVGDLATALLACRAAGEIAAGVLWRWPKVMPAEGALFHTVRDLATAVLAFHPLISPIADHCQVARPSRTRPRSWRWLASDEPPAGAGSNTEGGEYWRATARGAEPRSGSTSG